MKKGFTMIELIFVIVILGILASVAIPRLAATREDAEISAGIANIRMLLSDAASYYTVKGNFTGTKWKDFTNVPLKNADTVVGNAGSNAYLEIGGKDCLQVAIWNTPESTFFMFGKVANNSDPICVTFLETGPIKQLLTSTISADPNAPHDPNRGFCTGKSSGTIGCIDITPKSIY